MQMTCIKKELIDGDTALVGVIGCPIKHSLSPVIHNAALTELNLNWCYLAIPCTKDDFNLVIQGLRAIDCKGLNITIPHKNIAINACHKLTTIAKNAGAVNTLIPDKLNSWIGSNTDIEGFLVPLQPKKEWQKKTALVIGSGGSAKAVLHGLSTLEFSKIYIVGRNQVSLDNLLNEINKNQFLSTELQLLLNHDVLLSKYIKESDLIINATPVGMYPDTKEMPLGKKVWENLENNTTLYDLIYTPRPTEWLKLGKIYGCQTIDGLEMLIQQGAASLRLWSGIEKIPTKLMKQAAIKALNAQYN